MLILFEDIISFVLVVFAWFRLGDNMNIDRTTKRFFVGAGVLIAVMLILDQIWQVIFTVCTITAPVDRILNAITCIIYFLLTAVISVAPLQQMRKISCVRGIVNVIMLLFLAVIPIVNIWKPLIFYHSGGYMYYTKSFTWYLIIEYVIYVVMIRQYYSQNYLFDRSDRFMLLFAQGIVGLGAIAQIVYGDLAASWNCVSICYLFMYLALEQMYAKTDPVTKLHNREVYVKALRKNAGKKKTLTAVMFDLNHLKLVNDRYGHDAGDAYLLAFGQTSRKALSGLGEIFRIGGDEFCLLSWKAGPEELLPVLRELQGRGKCDPRYGDHPMDFAYGVAVQLPGEDGFDTVSRADQEMYKNKREMHSREETQGNGQKITMETME